MNRCDEIKQAIWSSDLTPEMIEHVLSCPECQQEQKLVQQIGITLDLEEIPLPSRTLLPSREEIEQAVISHRWRRLRKWATAGVAAACVLVAAVQVPNFLPLDLSKNQQSLADQKEQSEGQEQKGNAPERNELLGAKQDSNSLTAMDNLQKSEEQATALDPSIVSLLDTYGWTPTQEAFKTEQIALPKSFVDLPGTYPLGLYWAKHNVLSKDVGLDLNRHRGETVTAYSIPLQEMWDDGLKLNTTAVVLLAGQEVVGSWLEKGVGMSASLRKRDFADLVKLSWGDWLKEDGQVDYSQGPDGEFRNWNAEQVVLKYYEAIQNRDYPTAYAMYSKAYQASFWYAEKGEQLFAQDWNKQGLNPENVSSVRVIDLQQTQRVEATGQAESIKGERLNRKPVEERQYQVTLDITYKTQVVQQDGINALYLGVVKESTDAPWKIDWVNQSPR
ncbi:DUF4829 domain-containing protein [Tumebacillus lipolyticus]|uniref:DUF4829 domain-containing protein n=1 Tax=Tumebacillus lipolyticus TaxID=1280370 RepID=A0ABW5A0G9_9BACL